MLQRRRARQIHLWLSDREFDHLTTLAQANDETISSALRRLIRTSDERDRRDALSRHAVMDSQLKRRMS